MDIRLHSIMHKRSSRDMILPHYMHFERTRWCIPHTHWICITITRPSHWICILMLRSTSDIPSQKCARRLQNLKLSVQDKHKTKISNEVYYSLLFLLLHHHQHIISCLTKLFEVWQCINALHEFFIHRSFGTRSAHLKVHIELCHAIH